MTSHQQTRIISIYSEIRSVTDSTLTLSSATATVTDLSLGRTALQNKEMGTDMCAASGGRPMNTSLGLEFPAQPGRRFQPLPQTTVISGITALEMGSQNHDVDWLGRVAASMWCSRGGRSAAASAFHPPCRLGPAPLVSGALRA